MVSTIRWSCIGRDETDESPRFPIEDELDLFARLSADDFLRASKGVIAEMTRQQVAGE
jgi:hypothetical protein